MPDHRNTTATFAFQSWCQALLARCWYSGYFLALGPPRHAVRPLRWLPGLQGTAAIASVVYRTRIITSLIFKHSDKGLRYGPGTLGCSGSIAPHLLLRFGDDLKRNRKQQYSEESSQLSLRTANLPTLRGGARSKGRLRYQNSKAPPSTAKTRIAHFRVY